MAIGKYLSLEEARKLNKLKRFIKEHPSQADERFWPLMEAAAKGLPEGERTSDRAVSEGYSGTRTRPNTSEDVSGCHGYVCRRGAQEVPRGVQVLRLAGPLPGGHDSKTK